MPLWLALLAPEKGEHSVGIYEFSNVGCLAQHSAGQNDAGSPLADREQVVQALYDSLIQAVLDIIPALNLDRSNGIAQDNPDASTQVI